MQTTPRQKVIFDHDGGVDDLLSLMLLLSMDHVDLLGVTITPADCYLPDATESTLKLLRLFGREEVPVALGNLHGINAFPAEWRAQPKICNAFPMMLNTPVSDAQLDCRHAPQFIADTLIASDSHVTVLMTGPCTNLVAALKGNAAAQAKVKELVWMGGAVDVAGNVSTHNHNTSAEWNAFWDPIATQDLFALGIEIRLIALDATNELPVNKAFLQDLAKQADYPMSQLAGQFWATTVNSIPAYEFTYYMWDVLATSYLALGHTSFTFERAELAVSVKEPNAGQTYRSPGSDQWVMVATWADRDQVLDYVLKQFAR